MPNLLTLPRELSLHILSHLGFGDKLRLSAACKEYHTHFIPQIFENIWFTNDQEVANSALAAVKAYGEYTRRIEFTCREHEEEFTLPAPVLELLNGHHTPNLSTVKLDFDFDLDVYDWDENHPGATIDPSTYSFEEDEPYVRAIEPLMQWRALTNETWRALSANETVTTLIVHRFIPKWTSAFRTDEFRRFIGRLESAAFRIWDMMDGGEMVTEPVSAYCSFLGEEMNIAFFRHMCNLRNLEVYAFNGERFMEFNNIKLGMRPWDLPALESLKLVRCVVSSELVYFIQSHIQTLTSLDVGACVTGPGYLQDDYISWAEVFRQVRMIEPALTQLIAGGRNAPLDRQEVWGGGGSECKPVLEEIQEIRQKLEAQPELKLFGYAYLPMDEYEVFTADAKQNVKEFKRGTDWEEYQLLMDVINHNQSNKAKSNSHTSKKPKTYIPIGSPCGWCMKPGHDVLQCAGPPAYDGFIHACPLHNTSAHTLQDCRTAKDLDLRLKWHYLVFHRRNLPPLLSNDAWEKVAWDCADAAATGRFPVPLDSSLPFTSEFSKNIEAELFATYDYNVDQDGQLGYDESVVRQAVQGLIRQL